MESTPLLGRNSGRFYSAQKFERSSGPKAQPFMQRRAKPWYIGRTVCYILLCLAVFGPTGQEFACLLNPGGRSCLDGQTEHHRKMKFQEEFRAICRRHGIEIDERYVWD
jgi:hypothetical protein